MSTSKQAAREDAKATGNSKHPVADKVKDTLHESVDALAARAAVTEKSLREGAQNGSDNFAEKQAELQAKWNDSSVKRYASENPITTAGIAFAAGMLFTAILKRK
jgi:ElaB/YqjD/DUF883 family membrane-anchored ribosome-binding protein